MTYEKGLKDGFKFCLQEAKKVSNKQELMKKLEHALNLAKQKQFEKIQQLMKVA
jgi:hypothetical protein